VKIAICTPFYRDPSYHYTRSLVPLVAAATLAGAEIGYFTRQGSLVSIQRNLIAEAAVENGFEWLLWLDADHSFPSNTLHRLLGRGKPFVGCNYHRRDEADPRPTAARILPGGQVEPVAPGTGLERVDGMGLGVCLIHRNVFELVEKPWFAGIAEDYHFCAKAASKGVELYVDQDLSREIGHVGEKVYSFGQVA
jgi:hypothetical protein